jgi:thiamine biosynthesis lipoprotein
MDSLEGVRGCKHFRADRLHENYCLSRIPTMRSTLLLAAILLLTPCHDGSSTDSTRGKLYVFHYENVLGTSLELKVAASSPAQSEQAERAALAEIDRESHILSSWDPDSEFSRWFGSMDQPIHISPELFEVLGLFDEWRDRTRGALDASAETITRIWKKAAAENRLPSEVELQAGVASVRRVHWKLDPALRTATHTSDAPLALNSFVKSYIVGRAADAALGMSGARAIVVNIGGDLVVRGEWSALVDVADPKSDAENGVSMARLILRNRAVATSGTYRRGVDILGRHYSHIVDPRTGEPADGIISSTVVARTPVDAGALATALSVLTPAESGSLVASMPGAEYMLVRKNGERIISAGWNSLAAPPSSQPTSMRPAASFQTVAAQSGASLWDDRYELTIGIELSLIEGFRVRRPYVAVWIEDEKRSPVRTIVLWFAKFKFLHELYAWSLAENTLSTSEDTHVLNSVSSATRPPGRYTFRWDGKDDYGKPVKAGKYTVMIEAAREHGTDQLMRQEIDFNGSPKQFQLPGGVEITSASLDYHKVTR